MRLQNNIENIFIRLFSLKHNPKLLLIFYFLFSFFTFDLSKADPNKLIDSKNNQIQIDYLDSRNKLSDYIIDTGDVLSIDFQFEMFNGDYRVSEEGELLLPELDETYVRGLTTSELKSLLEKRYADFLIEPEIKVRIAFFKEIRVLIRGELRNPGFYQFPAYKSNSLISLTKERSNPESLLRQNDGQLKTRENFRSNDQSSGDIVVKNFSENVSTISDVIRKAGGITPLTDLSRIEIIRDIPLSKGGGKKRAIIDFNSYINKSDPINDIRIFDGDSLFFHKLKKANPNQVPRSILSGISPKFISVNLFGRVETPGTIKVPLEATLSDAIDLTGPIKPLSGKIILIRYEKDGTMIKKNISYSASAERGTNRNPYLKKDDLITVKNSAIGKSAGFLKELTAPFVGIYSTKELIEGFND